MFTHLGLSAWMPPVNLTLGSVINQALAFLWDGSYFQSPTQPTLTCLACLGSCMWKGQQWSEDRWQVLCMINSEAENWKPCISVNLKHSREQKQTPTGVLNPWTPQTITAFPGQLQSHRRKLRLQGSQGDISPGRKQGTANENSTEGLLMTLKCQSSALAPRQSSRCAYSTAHSTSPRRWLTDNSNLICPKQNSWFST